jgi:predicted metal-dependent hydrolase
MHPPLVGKVEIWAFLTAHREWIQKTLAKIPSSIMIEVGDTFSFFGELWQLKQDPLRKKGVWKQDRELIIGQNVENLTKAIESILKKEAQLFFEHWSRFYAKQLGATFTRISIRDGRSRWGSCSTSGTLSYSWRLGLAPLEIAQYVCAHEVAHLKEMNHSPRFWALVEKLDSSYKKHRTWLKKEGRELKCISFGSKKLLSRA